MSATKNSNLILFTLDGKAFTIPLKEVESWIVFVSEQEDKNEKVELHIWWKRIDNKTLIRSTTLDLESITNFLKSYEDFSDEEIQDLFIKIKHKRNKK